MLRHIWNSATLQPIRRSRRDKESSRGGESGHRDGTWPKQQPGYADEDHGGYTQDDHNVQYLQDLEENARLIAEQQQEASLAAKYAQVSKQSKKQQQQSGDRYYDKYSSYGDQGYHSGGHRSKQYRSRSPAQQQQQAQQHYSQERLQAARQAQEVVQCAKGDLSEQQVAYLIQFSAQILL